MSPMIAPGYFLKNVSNLWLGEEESRWNPVVVLS